MVPAALFIHLYINWTKILIYQFNKPSGKQLIDLSLRQENKSM